MNKKIDVEKKQLPGWIRTGIPVAVSGLILYYYMGKQDWQNVIDAARDTNYVIAFMAVLIPQIIFWWVDVLICYKLFTWFNKPFPWKDYLWAKGGLYLLVLVNTGIGGGGLIYYLYRKIGATWAKLLGIILFRCLLGVWAVGLLMIPGTLLMHYWGLVDKINVNVWVLWPVLITCAVWFLLAWYNWHYTNHFAKFFNIETEFWTAFREGTQKQWVDMLVLNAGAMFIMLAGIWVIALAFGIKIPFMEFIVAAPFMWFISELPIAFAGFGTTTVAWVLFFGNYGSEAAITGFTLFLPSARLIVRALLGTVSLPFALKDISNLLQWRNKRLA